MSDWLFSDRITCRAASIYPLLGGAILAGLSSPGKVILAALVWSMWLEIHHVIWERCK